MIFAINWIPQLRENALPPCHLIASYIEDNETPQFRHEAEKSWSAKGIKAEVEKAPEYARSAIQESVVAIWRLQKEQENGADDKVWMDHLEAWLVRELDPRARDFH